MKEKYAISGMTCSACSAGIERAVGKVEGVIKTEVSLMGETMVVEYDENKTDSEKIIQTVLSLGYGATLYDENIFKQKEITTFF